LIKDVTAKLSVPVIFTGGVGKLSDIDKVLSAGVDAVGIGAYCVFRGPNRAVLVTYPNQEQLSRELNWKTR